MKTGRNLWPLGIVLVFVLFFAGVIAVIVIAATHRDVLVSEDYYERELKFQGEIDAAARARACGATIRHNAAAGKILIALPAEHCPPEYGGKINLYHASTPALDREFPLDPKGDGTQALDVSQLAGGSWQVRVRWSAAGREFLLEQKIRL